MINIYSLGFKYYPEYKENIKEIINKEYSMQDFELITFDVRDLNNPYYDEKLKNKNGLDEEVQKYIMSFSETTQKIESIKKEVNDKLKKIEQKDKLIIVFTCTGGQHRSVFIAETIYKYIFDLGLDVDVKHLEKNRWEIND